MLSHYGGGMARLSMWKPLTQDSLSLSLSLLLSISSLHRDDDEILDMCVCFVSIMYHGFTGSSHHIEPIGACRLALPLLQYSHPRLLNARLFEQNLLLHLSHSSHTIIVSLSMVMCDSTGECENMSNNIWQKWAIHFALKVEVDPSIESLRSGSLFTEHTSRRWDAYASLDRRHTQPVCLCVCVFKFQYHAMVTIAFGQPALRPAREKEKKKEEKTASSLSLSPNPKLRIALNGLNVLSICVSDCERVNERESEKNSLLHDISLLGKNFKLKICH